VRDLQVDVEDLLKRMQVENLTDAGDELAFSCPFPGHAHGDTRPSAYMNRSSTLWMCHGCKRRGNVVSFVAELENVSPLKASRWLREKYAPGFKEPESGSMAKEWLEFEVRPEGMVFEDRNPPLTVTQQRKLVPVVWTYAEESFEDGNCPVNLEYWFARGFTADTLRTHEFVWDPHTQRICMTVRDEEDNVVGFKGRSSDPDAQPKYLVIGDRRGRNNYGFEPYKVTHVVYGLHDAKDHTEHKPGGHHELIVCEGELNAVKMRQHGWKNAVGLPGSELSDVQADLICRYCDRATLIFDSDKAGHTGLWGYDKDDGRHVSGAVEKLCRRISVLVVDEHDADPASMTRDEIDDLLLTAKSAMERWVPAA
jgi:DNA primase